LFVSRTALPRQKGKDTRARHSPFIGNMQQVGVHAKRGLSPFAGWHWDVVLLCIGD